ncbi:phosphoribosyltransferase [Nitrosovibrio sp. Nv17]|uniref:phosphoribosyltransferase n=1 Tax=Nitrosovibrio sp. Nv17 TaxID=1855339 RepID=UPI0009088560|nr:phosphoribosyltransferase [Nitrosovibrio sp. Nv17]SFW39508.1 hypothetical protein SAMN05216414_1343 [Nitrosovibrio sp. Nv17]
MEDIDPRAIQLAIRRATQAAQRAMDTLDADILKELEQIYTRAATELRARIAAAGGTDGNIPLQQLQDVLGQVESRLHQLAAERNALLENGLENAARFGAAPLTAAGAGVDAAAAMGAQPGTLLESDAAMRVSDEAVRFVRAFIAEDGLQLSDRIWRLDRHAREAVTNAIEMAIIQGHGAAQAARELLMRGQAVPAELADKMNAANAARTGEHAAGLLTGRGSPMDNAMRLMRTEINRAHGEAYIAGALAHPDAAGVRFLLSPAHPEPDICDLHATANLYGLGPGVYPTREACPWPAHPNTLSYVEVVFKDEITDADRAGKETVAEVLARMTPAQREGVLGVNKAKAFDAGRSQQGMAKAQKRAVPGKTASARVRMHPVKPALHTPHPDRSPWRDFSDVIIHADISTVKGHEGYLAAKSGDIAAAAHLVRDMHNPEAIRRIADAVGTARPTLVAVSAIEEQGENVIPTALAGIIGRTLDLASESDIVQINRVSHTGAKGDYRLATPALFDGLVVRGMNYLLVDDFIGQGGTLANLRGFIENRGGQVLLATTLTGKAYSVKLSLSPATLTQLRQKHGNSLEEWWKARYGYGFEFLTESEARYLERIENADAIRDRILAAAQEA